MRSITLALIVLLTDSGAALAQGNQATPRQSSTPADYRRQAEEQRAKVEEMGKEQRAAGLACSRVSSVILNDSTRTRTCAQVKEFEALVDECKSRTDLYYQHYPAAHPPLFLGGDPSVLRQRALASTLAVLDGPQRNYVKGDDGQVTMVKISDATQYAKAEYYEKGDLPDGLITGAETPEAFAERMKTEALPEVECLGGQKAAAEYTAKLDMLVATSVKLRAEEAACRKNKKCMTRRENLKGFRICELIEAIKEDQEIIQRERSNPSGVVDLRVLHVSGEALQGERREIQEKRAAFRKAYKRDFPEAFCREFKAQ